MHLLACCLNLNVTLENEVKNEVGWYDGIYTFGGISNDMDYFVHSEHRMYALWFYRHPNSYPVIKFWMFGYKSNVGLNKGWITQEVADKKCPKDGEYPWLWHYFNAQDWIAIPTTDIAIRCLDPNDV